MALGWWAGLVALYLLLVDTTETAEVAAALIIAAIATASLLLVTALGMAHGAPRLRWLALLARRLPARVVKDCAIVFAALWRRLVLREAVDGAFRVVHFDPGGDDPRSAARRALIVAGISLPPNSYVVSLDAEAGSLLIHYLVPPRRPDDAADREWPL